MQRHRNPGDAAKGSARRATTLLLSAALLDAVLLCDAARGTFPICFRRHTSRRHSRADPRNLAMLQRIPRSRLRRKLATVQLPPARRQACSARVALRHAMRRGRNHASASFNAATTLAGCGVTPQVSRKRRHVARNCPSSTQLEIRFRIRLESPAALVQRHPHMLRKTRRSGRPKRKLLASAAVHVLGTQRRTSC